MSTSRTLQESSASAFTQLDTFARLQLAAAIIESDIDNDGNVARLAENSAIFAPYRNGVAVDTACATNDPSVDFHSRYSTAVSLDLTGDDNDGLTHNEHHAVLRQPQRKSVQEPHHHDQRVSRSLPIPVLDTRDLDDSDLASEWGLDSVLSRFDSTKFNTNTLGLGKDVKRKKTRRMSTSQSEILSLGRGGESAQEDDAVSVISRGLSDQLDLSGRPRAKRRGTGDPTIRRGLEAELETAFSLFGNGDENLSDGQSQHAASGGRSRSSSFGFSSPLIDCRQDVISSPEIERLATGQESPWHEGHKTRSHSRMSSYTSRFDPKAVAQQREEHLHTRLKFSTPLIPKILIMPSPLADMLPPTSSQAEKHEAAPKPRIVREAGKLYGKSLMDELHHRKVAQSKKKTNFKGDNRRLMMDNVVSQANAKSRQEAFGENTRTERSNANEEGIQVIGPSDTGNDGGMQYKSKESGNDTWAKYASQRSLSGLLLLEKAQSSESPSNGGRASGPLSQKLSHPILCLSPEDLPSLDQETDGNEPSEESLLNNRQSELSRRSRQGVSYPNMPSHGPHQPESDTEDDDVPLDVRKTNLANKTASGQLGNAAPLVEPAVQSVFGQDLVMARELKKLEEILKVEKAEANIKTEKERVKLAEKKDKENRKRAKLEERLKKKMRKDRKKHGITETSLVSDQLALPGKLHK